MSIDIFYSAFSASQADALWKYFAADLEHIYQQAQYYRIKSEVDAVSNTAQAPTRETYKKNMRELRHEIFNFFEKKGYYPPRLGSWKPAMENDEGGESFMEYLLSYGCVYAPGSKSTDKNADYLMLRRDAPELEEYYQQKKAEYWNIFTEESKRATERATQRLGKKCIEPQAGNERQQKLGYSPMGDILFGEKKPTKTKILQALKFFDLAYGSVGPSYFLEDPAAEEPALKAINKVMGKTQNQKLPDRGTWIQFFTTINNNIMTRVVSDVAAEFSWSYDEAYDITKGYLQGVRQLVQKLQENKDAFILSHYSGVYEVEPQSAEIFMIKRAQEHYQTHQQLIKKYIASSQAT